MKKLILLILFLLVLPALPSSSMDYGSPRIPPVVRSHYRNHWCFHASAQSLNYVPQCVSGNYAISLYQGSYCNCCGDMSQRVCCRGVEVSIISAMCDKFFPGARLRLLRQACDGINQNPYFPTMVMDWSMGHAYVAYHVYVWGNPEGGMWFAEVDAMCPSLGGYKEFRYELGANADVLYGVAYP